MLNELSRLIHANAKEKGFYQDKKNIGEMLCLIHSEVSKALEADRKDKHTTWNIKAINSTGSNERFIDVFEANVKNTFQDELSDIIIRALDLAAFKEIDIEAHIRAKMRYDNSREYKHGKKY